MFRWLSATKTFLLTPRGDRRWDLLVRGTGVVSLLCLPVVLYLPELTPLVWFAVLSVAANSPLSPITPVAFEPLIMEAAKYAPAIQVTVVGLAVYMYMEYLNWHLYRWVLTRDRLRSLREKPWVERCVGYFGRAPALTTVVFAFTPLPFWVVRILAIYREYSLKRFMVATAIGRFPRIYLYAWLGAVLTVPTVVLVSVAVGTTLVVVAWRLAKRKRVIEDAVLDHPEGAVQPEGIALNQPEAAMPHPSDIVPEGRAR